MAMVVFGLILLLIPITFAGVVEDISYQYSSGVLAESSAMFDDASEHYRACIDLAVQNNMPEWMGLCEKGLNRTSSITTIKTRDLLIVKEMNWEFRGEALTDNGITQYFLADNELVIVNAYKLSSSLNDEYLDSLLSMQKKRMSDFYNFGDISELLYKDIKIKYISGSQKNGVLTGFIGVYFDNKNNEVYGITASVSDLNAFLKGFEPQIKIEDYGIYIMIVVIIIIAILGWLYYHGHKKLPIGKPKPIHQ